ncbi:uncharacterized protein LOC108051754 [Drosophila rhopaloa]|uniref:Uncharacterized protein LOC108051754 n=1 Tax=Drosophila rhopaloa TaxID=1041015 RepID=A0A6P4FW83_DRORH|nr:uncharacterized protein LOC108051754 [Drosophila rhopaloa]
MKFVAFLLLSSLTIAMVVAFPDNHAADVGVSDGEQHAVSLATPADAGCSDQSTSADQVTNCIRRPRHLLSKLLLPKTVVVQPVIVERVVPAPYSGYSQPYPYYNTDRRLW